MNCKHGIKNGGKIYCKLDQNKKQTNRVTGKVEFFRWWRDPTFEYGEWVKTSDEFGLCHEAIRTTYGMECDKFEEKK